MIDLAEARARLGRECVTLPDPVPAHPLLDGKQEIGRGEYSIVLDKGDGERVYKVISSPADYFLYTAEDRPRGPHFPIVYADHGIIGRASSGYPFHLIEMERLYPLQEDTQAAALASRLIEFYWASCQQWSRLGMDMGRIALHNLTVNPLDVSESMKQSLKALSDFVEEYQVLPDILNTNNLMMRKDGTLVFSDPVFIA
ncbi:hypothetical protein E6C76_05095 [Pseudothauera nasutitermitis]|uniref:Uncharacterized protein n=1 Tax=Pseudothauera nasutitermitis TaxID=2565930 RepID=A0A4S4B217_9RHOO|nr:hypothetical protein [Pseudothauera nasutitermitis]THF66235.1 hypothetical protein E6C76_05095 [Pseudothauera nasutitermitis]